MQLSETEIFRTAIKYCLKKLGWGGQKKIADKAKISAIYFNDIIKGRKPGSESARAAIAAAFGYAYEDFLKLGRSLLEEEGSGKLPPEPALRKKRLEAEPPLEKEKEQEALSRPRKVKVRISDLLSLAAEALKSNEEAQNELAAKILKNNEDIQKELTVLRRSNLETKEKIEQMEKEIAFLEKRMDEEGELKIANGE